LSTIDELMAVTVARRKSRALSRPERLLSRVRHEYELAREHVDELVFLRMPVTHRGRGARPEGRVIHADFREPCRVAERAFFARQDL